MPSAAPEFSRWVDVSRLGHLAHDVEIEASESERAALAQRFGLAGLDRLRATLTIQRRGEDGLIELKGGFAAKLRQFCVVTLETFAVEIDQPMLLYFGDAVAVQGTVADPLAPLDDAEPLDRGGIDCGEAVAQQLAVALDPYPRAPGAKMPQQEPPAQG